MVTQVLRTAAVRRAMADEMRAKKISRREALQAGAGVRRGNRRELLARLRRDHRARAHVVLDAAVRRRRGASLRASAEGQPRQRRSSTSPAIAVTSTICCCRTSIYYRGYAVPHIAAGINLNMPVVGRFLRKGGAFYIRRSFKGNALYTMVFMKYLGLMMARGHSIEYFIEGGRSRTGRLLQPKTGMLSMTLRSYLRDPRRPVVFLPVYFGYERLVEGKTYISELSGKPKEKESVFGMLRTLPALRERFGKVHVSFGEPIRLDDVLDKHAPRAPLPEKEERPAWLGAGGRRARRTDHDEHQQRGLRGADESDRARAARDAEAVDARERSRCGSSSSMPRCCARRPIRRSSGSPRPTARRWFATASAWASCSV